MFDHLLASVKYLAENRGVYMQLRCISEVRFNGGADAQVVGFPYADLAAGTAARLVESVCVREGTDYRRKRILAAEKVAHVIGLLARGEAQSDSILNRERSIVGASGASPVGRTESDMFERRVRRSFRLTAPSNESMPGLPSVGSRPESGR